MKQSSKIFVGMDVHKESIDITLAEQGGEVRRFGEVGGDRTALLKAVRRLSSRGGELVFVYEAGPCGFWIHREIGARGGTLHTFPWFDCDDDQMMKRILIAFEKQALAARVTNKANVFMIC